MADGEKRKQRVEGVDEGRVGNERVGDKRFNVWTGQAV